MRPHHTIERLEAVLKSKKWKKNRFQVEMGITSQTYNNWRVRGIPATRIRDAAGVLGISRDWLETGQESTLLTDRVAEDVAAYNDNNEQIEIDRIVGAFRKLSMTQRGLMLMLMENMNQPPDKSNGVRN